MDASDDDQRTVWCGNLSDKITEDLLYELFLQAAPLQRVRIPTDKEGKNLGYGFVTFKHIESVGYSTELLNGIPLFERCLNVKPRHWPQQQNSYQRENSPQMQIPYQRENSPQMQPTSRRQQQQSPQQLLLHNLKDFNALVHMGQLLNPYAVNVGNQTQFPVQGRWQQNSSYHENRYSHENTPYSRHSGERHRNHNDHHRSGSRHSYDSNNRYRHR